MKIAILGTRGIPARYGGFETLADELSRRLVERGHEVSVYCRKPFTRPDDVFDSRVKRVILPTVSEKHFDTLSNTLLSTLHVIFTSAEVVLICNVANSPWSWIPRVVGKPTALNVDGLDRKRRKWNIFGQWFLHFCEVLSTFTPTSLITDAEAVRKYYRERYGQESQMIAYGADPPCDNQAFRKFGLCSRRYILYVARLEPENNPELVINAYRTLNTDWPLLVVGWNPYQPAYVDKLKSLADKRVIFTGPVYGQDYWSLQQNAGLFVFAGEIGGIHPALVEAMAAGNVTLYLDTPANHETTRECGISFGKDPAELSATLQKLLDAPEQLQEIRLRTSCVAKQYYGWEAVVDKYEELFTLLVRDR